MAFVAWHRIIELLPNIRNERELEQWKKKKQPESSIGYLSVAA